MRRRRGADAEGPVGGLLAASLLALVVAGGAPPAEAAEPQRYDLDVRLEPHQRQVSVAGHVRVAVGEDEDALSFGLYEAFRIEECRIDGEPASCVRTGSAGANPREVTVPLPGGRRDGLVELEIRYAGAIENRPGWGQPGAEGPFMDDSAGPERVELALYSNWYPSFGYGPLFDAEVGLTFPRNWRVTCIGQEKDRRTTAAETTTRWEARSVSDVVIVASPRLRSTDVETAAGRVRIHHTRLPESYLQRDVRETEQTLLLFSETLGVAPGDHVLQHVYSPRDWGQGFARPGMIVMAEGYLLRALQEDPETSFVKGNAHEAAHFWWREGAGQGDWINEAFAEYFALLALRDAQGEEPFRADLEEKRKVVGALPDDAPAIAVVPPDNSGTGYTIRYDKGALMLEAFRERLGDEAFARACRGFYEAIRGQKAGTTEFRAYWKSVLGDDALLSAWLDSPGSGPVPSGWLPERRGGAVP